MNTLVCLENDAKGIVEAVKRKDVIIVIDALRCSSTIVTALANGAKSVIPVKSVSQARRLKKKHPDFLLAGERRGLNLMALILGTHRKNSQSLMLKEEK